jgi:cyclic beta-1,2-glucan synthetase
MWRPFWKHSPPPERPSTNELLSLEQLEERAKALAVDFGVDVGRGRPVASVLPGFSDNVRLLEKDYGVLAEDARTGEFVTAAGRWLIDNFHLITAEIREVRRHLSRRYYAQLPRVARGADAGHARIYLLAVDLIVHTDARLDAEQLRRFLNSFQTVDPLTIGELWAWPSLLKLALVERLRRLADEGLAAREARRTADERLSKSSAER